MNLKLLIFGPGAPDRQTSGLGKAAMHLTDELAKHVDLTLIEPKQVETLATKKVDHETLSFSDFSILKELATVSIESQLSAYHYQEVTSANTMEKVESQRLYKQLTTFSEELVLAGKKTDFEVIYAHDWITFKAALELKQKFGKPLLLHVHSLDFDRNFGQSTSWIFDLEKKAMMEADAVIAVSQYSKKIMSTEYGIPEEKIHVVYHGHTHAKHLVSKSPFTEKIVLFVGRLSGQKGPMQFLDIAEKVHEKYPNTRFVMSGDGDLYKKLIEAGAASHIADRFHITGYLGHDDLQKLYGLADVYCMPSFSEPFGLTALEAADAGLPLVLSDKCGAAELLPEAALADPGNVIQFAEEIVAILQDPKKSKARTEAHKEIIKNLTWKRSASKILSVIESII
ncbi:MAG: glycosyltransferase [Reichenbachiella sp.]|uniref:glycosyltransferase n=1 Tax=Reichenbachiella sp. TaxID=2184521 RepID=UPI003266CE8F